MFQPIPLSWLRAGQSVSNSFMLSVMQSSRTYNFNVFCLTRSGIEPPTSRMPGGCLTTTLPGRIYVKWNCTAVIYLHVSQLYSAVKRQALAVSNNAYQGFDYPSSKGLPLLQMCSTLDSSDTWHALFFSASGHSLENGTAALAIYSSSHMLDDHGSSKGTW